MADQAVTNHLLKSKGLIEHAETGFSSRRRIALGEDGIPKVLFSIDTRTVFLHDSALPG